jgi:glycosyltransferase involved in cell wall biosynthesis
VLATSVHYAEGSKHLAAVREKVSIATCGVDLGTFYHRELLDEKILDEMTGREVVLFVGSLDPSHSHKGLDVLIRAVAAIKNHSNREALLVVVGEGDARDSYEVLARDTGASVKFVGGVKDDCLAQLYTIAKVCVLPSTNRSEGLGLVLIEAAACGTAVIGSAIGGIPHAIVDGETGILVLPADEKSLAEAIEYLLVDDERARALGAAGRERVVREFSWDASASVTNEALVSAVNRAVEEQGTTSALSE